MALRSADGIDAGLLQRLGYQPGLPAGQFSGARIADLVLACCAPHAATASASA